MTTKFDLSKFHQSARKMLERAQNLAATLRHSHVEIEHAIVAALEPEASAAREAIEAAGGDAKRIGRRAVEELELLARSYRRPEQVFVGKGLLDVLGRAREEAEGIGDELVTPAHVMIAIAAGKGFGARVLGEEGAGAEALREAMRQSPTKQGARAPKQSASPGGLEVLSKFATNLCAMAADGELQRVVGRDAELRRMMQVLSRRTKNNPVLIGPPGVGKTTIVEGLAQRIVADDVPIGLKKKTIMSLDVGSLVAGTSLRGQFEERIRAIIDEVIASEGDVLLFVDEIHTLVGAGGGDGPMNAAGLLKPALARGQISLLGTTTADEYREFIEVDAALERRFQAIVVEEPSIGECVSILRGIKQSYEIHHNVQIQDDALIAAAKMTDRYLPSRALPDKAIDAIDEAASRLRLAIDSMPNELDASERRAAQLELELSAIAGERGAEIEREREEMERELAQVRQRASGLRARWDREKESLAQITQTQEELEACEREMEEAQRSGELGRAAELRYSVIPKIKQKLEEARAERDESSGQARLLKDSIDESNIAAVIGDWTGIPVSKMVESEKEKLLRMPERLSESVIGQRPAIEIISEYVRTRRAGLTATNRPIGNFMFVGPTGVGKTELAKALARFLFDDEDAIVRIDMSEYMEQSKVNTLIGSAIGYVGSERGGVLTEAVRQRPYSVVLFDEAEKAHPDVFNILLQVMDEGRLTDSAGRRIDFTNTLVILTSNVGSRRIMELTQADDFSAEDLEEAIEEVLKEHFRPEFLNRLDKAIPFRALGLDDIKLIAKIEERKVRALLAEQRYGLEMSEEALDFLAREGFEPEFGARPLKRSFATHLNQPLAVEVLEGKFAPGDTIRIALAPSGDRLAFERVIEGEKAAE